MQGNLLGHPNRCQFAASLGRKDGLILVTRHPRGAVQKGLKFRRHDHPGGPRRGGEPDAQCDRRAESQEIGASAGRGRPPAVRRDRRGHAGAVSGAPPKARRRGGLVLLTMSTPAPALVITTPTEVGGALSMLSEVARERGAASVAPRHEGALHLKPRPGPHSGERSRPARAIVRGDDRAGRRPRL